MNQMMHFAHRHDGGAYLIESPVPALPPAEVRCLSINDRDRLDRDAFVTALFPQVDIRTFADEDTHIISRAEWDYDVVIISGNDVKRMGRYLRINSPLLGVAARIALISDSTPARRAMLFNLGFDEVLDSTRMAVEEGALRMLARIRQVQANRNLHRAMIERHNLLADFCDPDALTRRESDVLQCLARRPGRAVSHFDMIRVINPSNVAGFRNSLKVVVSNLRKKLHDSFVITCAMQGEYTLSTQATSAPTPAVAEAAVV